METAFAWLGQIFDAVLKFVPRIVIVRATHAGVRWRMGARVHAMPPGLHVYWPLTTDIEVLVTARQTNNVPIQVLLTKDRVKLVAGAVVVFKIRDIVQAIGKNNWDVDTTVNDITQAALASVIAESTFDELLAGLSNGELNIKLTQAVRKELRQFGVFVSRCKLVNFADCKVYKLVTAEPNHEALAAR
jgi:regulator of protease activity HflC (stomatin/prohibitin superfamily)